MKQIRFVITTLAVAAAGLISSGCLTEITTYTPTVTKYPDGTSITNIVKTVKAKGMDPLKDKVDRATVKQKGLWLKMFPSPAGTSGGFSPFELVFGESTTIWNSYPVYPGITNGYTPPFSVASSSSGSLWNDADNENIASASNLNPTNAYYQSTAATANPLAQTSGTVAAPSPTIIYTNAPAAAVTTTNTVTK